MPHLTILNKFIRVFAFGLAFLFSANSFAAKDPFAGETWHAVGQSWPGTLVFDGAKKKVVLSPLGAPVINATYVFTAKTVGPKTEGSLTMTDAAGAKSEATYVVTGKKDLELTFPAGLRSETYRRLSAKEQEIERAKAKQILQQSGVIRLK